MEISAWNSWLERVREQPPEQFEQEIGDLTRRDDLPFVERNLRLGYLYFVQDALGAATNTFRNIVSTVSQQREDAEFVRENRAGLNILYMGWRVVEDGCGGFELRETGCGGGGSAGPFCCCGCVCILVVMGICGVNLGDITNCGSGAGEPGCLDNFMNNCFSGCGKCCGCRWFD